MRSSLLVVATLGVGVAFGALHAFGCTSSKSADGPVGGPASGSADEHCTVPSTIVQTTDPASCHPDAGPPDGAPPVDYGPTMFGSEGDDDDCKYHVTYTISPVRENVDVSVNLNITRKSDGRPATGADPYIEGYLNDTHSIANSGVQTTEAGNGNYTIAPIRFDAPGRWTIRFHMYGDCSDFNDDSPHGHAAFYIDVP